MTVPAVSDAQRPAVRSHSVTTVQGGVRHSISPELEALLEGPEAPHSPLHEWLYKTLIPTVLMILAGAISSLLGVSETLVAIALLVAILLLVVILAILLKTKPAMRIRASMGAARDRASFGVKQACAELWMAGALLGGDFVLLSAALTLAMLLSLLS